MDYLQKLRYHYKPQKGWINDPNGLVYFKGYYHVFYQHSPDFETPWNQPMHWGHARTKDFLNWEELPVALYPYFSVMYGEFQDGRFTVKHIAEIDKGPEAAKRFISHCCNSLTGAGGSNAWIPRYAFLLEIPKTRMILIFQVAVKAARRAMSLS